MDINKKLEYCSHCLGNNITSKDYVYPEELQNLVPSKYGTLIYYTVYKGFIANPYSGGYCPTCKSKLISMNLTLDEWDLFNDISLDQNFIFAMDKLKQDDIIEFTTKISQFKEQRKQDYLTKKQLQQQSDTTPKCPTCGSTNIKKISATKRWVSTGILGLGSSDLGKTMYCESCGAKW